MTTILTRLYADPAAARAVRRTLAREGFRDADVDLIAAAEGDTAATLAPRLARAMVHPDAVDGIAARLAAGAGAVVVRADYTPLGARRIARAILDAGEPLADAPGPAEHEVRTPPKPAGPPSILKDHPLFFRIDIDPGAGRDIGLISRFMGVPLLTGSGHRDSVAHPGGPLTWRFAPMLLDRPRKPSVLPGGGTVFSDRLGWRTVISR